MSEDSATWQVHQFILPDDQILHFTQLYPHPKDGIINFFEVAKFMDKNTAAVMRLLTRNSTMSLYSIENVMKLMLPQFLWHFKVISTEKKATISKSKKKSKTKQVDLSHLECFFDELKRIQPNHMILGVAEIFNKHVFFIVYHLDNKLHFMNTSDNINMPLDNMKDSFKDVSKCWILSSIRILEDFYTDSSVLYHDIMDIDRDDDDLIFKPMSM